MDRGTASSACAGGGDVHMRVVGRERYKDAHVHVCEVVGWAGRVGRGTGVPGLIAEPFPVSSCTICFRQESGWVLL